MTTIFVNHNKKIQQSGLHNNTLTKCIGDGWNNAAYAREWMNNQNKTGIYSWSIKIEKGNRNIYVGIISDSHHQQNKDFDTKHSYAIDITNGRVNFNGKFQGFPGPQCGEGDVFTFIVNFRQRQLECVKNYDVSDKRILVENIRIDESIRYKLALNIYYYEDIVTVTDNNVLFHVFNGLKNNDHDDYIHNDHHIDEILLKHKIYAVTSSCNDDIESEPEFIEITETIKCIKELENEIFKKQTIIRNKYETLQQQYVSFWAS